MQNTTISLKQNESTTVFGKLTITHSGIDFSSYEKIPPIDAPGRATASQQHHTTTINLQLAAHGLITTEILKMDDMQSKNTGFIEWHGYRITFVRLNGYTDTEVSFRIDKLTDDSSQAMRQKKTDRITELNKRNVTLDLTYSQSVTVFDAFGITLRGLRSEQFKPEPDAPGQNRERIEIRLDGFGMSSTESVKISSKANYIPKPVFWHNYKISYLGHNPMGARFLIEEVPEHEPEKKPAEASIWKKILQFLKF